MFGIKTTEKKLSVSAQRIEGVVDITNVISIPIHQLENTNKSQNWSNWKHNFHDNQNSKRSQQFSCITPTHLGISTKSVSTLVYSWECKLNNVLNTFQNYKSSTIGLNKPTNPENYIPRIDGYIYSQDCMPYPLSRTDRLKSQSR